MQCRSAECRMEFTSLIRDRRIWPRAAAKPCLPVVRNPVFICTAHGLAIRYVLTRLDASGVKFGLSASAPLIVKQRIRVQTAARSTRLRQTPNFAFITPPTPRPDRNYTILLSVPRRILRSTHRRPARSPSSRHAQFLNQPLPEKCNRLCEGRNENAQRHRQLSLSR
jgi:hypothetical protein